jgi:uncharacterized protein YqeY
MFLSSLISDIDAKSFTPKGRVDLTDSDVIGVLKNTEKKLNELLSIENIPANILKKTHAEVLYIKDKLPKQMSQVEIEASIQLAEIKTFPEAMKYLKDNFNGLYDGKFAADVLKSYFSS